MERRNEILHAIQAKPGITFRELARELGIGIGDLQYHLRRLEKEGRIFSRKVGKRRYLFPRGFEEEAQRLLIAISTETRRRILLLLLEGQRNQKDVAEKLNLSQPTVSYHMGELVKLGIVRARKDGKSVIYSLSYDPEVIARVIRDYRPGLWEKLADNLIDLLAGMGEEE
ncbi:transcription regulator, ArsR family 8 [Thermococcus cleftensis]|uniref:Transcription regulator, ArsR family 8 n=1 Tax=Thermococcus cleftensis (strain DSM 27260 / KACC 17922 / CL1) TaxID=163003 RepID=I3ZUT6_THECF|nr:metalloregulator ArsR/SmtB family transcription factor [Thermococcus cleftensis]AFL95470.1 transcription regulator, ArsR family 8 [Thermococcus cleftensis]